MWDENTLGTLPGDQPGDYDMPTNPQTPGAFGNIFNQLAQTYKNTGLGGVLSGLFSGGVGGQMGQMAAFGGLAALLNEIAGQQKQAPVGYQGGIPEYKISREQTSAAQQRPQGYRPGQGGISYFAPVTYTATGKDLAPVKAGQVVGGGEAPVPVYPTESTQQSGIGSLIDSGQMRQAQSVRPSGMTRGPRGTAVGRTDASYQALQNALQGVPGNISDPSRSQAFADIRRELESADPDTGRFGEIDPTTLKKLGAPEWAARFRPSYALAVQAATSPDQTKFWQDYARRMQARTAPGATLKPVGRTAGLPIYAVPHGRSGDSPTIGDVSISNSADVARLESQFGFTPAELMGASQALKKSGFDDPSNIVSTYLDTKIANAVEESLKQGFSMDDVYTGAMRNFNIPRDRVEAALAARSAKRAAGGGMMDGGISMLARGGNVPRYLRGPGDGVSDDIAAKFDRSGQPARLADGEFVIDARTVSEIGNGSSEAGARKLYAMMDRVHALRKRAKRGKPSGADRVLNKLVKG